jgi:hypothetical protein
MTASNIPLGPGELYRRYAEMISSEPAEGRTRTVAAMVQVPADGVLVAGAERAKLAARGGRRAREVVRALGAALGDNHPAADDRIFAKLGHRLSCSADLQVGTLIPST